jgi:hypothetical protein
MQSAVDTHLPNAIGETMNRVIIPVVLVALLLSRPAGAQSGGDQFQLGVQLAGAVSSEFDRTDIGVGGRFSWHPTALLGAEAEVDFYPDDFADEPAFSRSRVEGLFGVTVGPRIGGLRPFGKLRPGFVTFRDAPKPFACILIFPPPLSCRLAGETVFALDFGGGVELFPTGRTFVRVDAGDRVVRYPSPVLDRDGTPRENAFFSHDFRFAIGGGVRF